MDELNIHIIQPDEVKTYFRYIERDFAKNEYPPYPQLLKQVKTGVQKGMAIHHDGREVAYTFCATGNAGEYVLDTLLAVLPDYRGKGIGTGTLKLVRRRYADKKAIIVEVEAPENAKSQADCETCKRRMMFYSRFGFYEVPNIQYSIWNLPMHLMALPITAGKEVINAEIKTAMTEIYETILGKRLLYKMQLQIVPSFAD